MLRVFWFRKDLRIVDNCALSNFVNDIEKGDKILFLFVKNRNSYEFFGKKRITFLFECLDDLSAELAKYGINLKIAEGKSLNVFKDILKQVPEAVIYANEQPEPWCRKRDEEIAGLCNRSDAEFRLFTDSTLFKPGEIAKDNGKPYEVFTPFSKKAFSVLDKQRYQNISYDLKKLSKNASAEIKGLNTYKKFKANTTLNSSLFKGGRTEGLKRLKFFYENILEQYRSKRDFPGIDGTSQLSPHIHFGTVSIREAVRTAFVKYNKVKKAFAKEEVFTWIKELMWREFYYNISHSFPGIDKSSFQKKFDKLSWNTSSKDFKAWSEGKTGYPIVDAGMRQLNQTGWMHNRVRMITAMFLTKDLLIDWRKGEKYFAENLVDMDFSNNNGGWQWSASTGVDAQPYFRIFNPVTQSKKFDPEGVYIKKYVPELKDVPLKMIHSPWEMTIEEQKKFKLVDYPAPIVDHKTAREKALKEFEKVK